MPDPEKVSLLLIHRHQNIRSFRSIPIMLRINDRIFSEAKSWITASCVVKSLQATTIFSLLYLEICARHRFLHRNACNLKDMTAKIFTDTAIRVLNRQCESTAGGIRADPDDYRAIADLYEC